MVLCKHSVVTTLFLAGLSCMGQPPPSGPVLPPAIQGYAAPFYSSDNAIAVYASLSAAGYRAPILSFANQQREELQRLLRLKFGSRSHPIEIRIGSSTSGDTRVLSRRLRQEGGGITERIDLPDPESANLDRFKEAISISLLRSWMVDTYGSERNMADLPMWLIRGVLRHLERENRQADIDTTLRLWSQAALPPAAELFRYQSLATTQEPAIAGVLAGWFLDRRNGVMVFESLLQNAAMGKKWSVKTVAQLLFNTSDLHQFDYYTDLRLLAEGRMVVTPGLTTDEITRRFRSSLLLISPFFGNLPANKEVWCSLAEAIKLGANPEIRKIAALQAVRIKIAATGRDGMLLAVAEAYTHLLEQLAAGVEYDVLRELLTEAEQMRGAMERLTAQGKIQQREK